LVDQVIHPLLVHLKEILVEIRTPTPLYSMVVEVVELGAVGGNSPGTTNGGVGGAGSYNFNSGLQQLHE
jgi:hypothetical protein